MQFNLTDLPLHLLLAAWLYRRLWGMKTNSITIIDSVPSMIPLFDMAKAYENAIDSITNVAGNSGKYTKVDASQMQYNQTDKKLPTGIRALLIVWLLDLLEDYVKNTWTAMFKARQMGIYDVAIMPLKKEE